MIMIMIIIIIIIITITITITILLKKIKETLTNMKLLHKNFYQLLRIFFQVILYSVHVNVFNMRQHYYQVYYQQHQLFLIHRIQQRNKKINNKIIINKIIKKKKTPKNHLLASFQFSHSNPI